MGAGGGGCKRRQGTGNMVQSPDNMSDIRYFGFIPVQAVRYRGKGPLCYLQQLMRDRKVVCFEALVFSSVSSVPLIYSDWAVKPRLICSLEAAHIFHF